MKHLYSVLTIMVFAFLFIASATVQQLPTKYEATYADMGSKKTSTDTTVSYILPAITPDAETKQMQTKGGVTISCEIVPFSVSRNTIQAKSPFYRDPAKPEYDVFQVANKPHYKVTPQSVQFTITIKNNLGKNLNLQQSALVMKIDGVQYSIPKEKKEEWLGTIIIPNSEEVFSLTGPSIDEIILNNAKVVYIAAYEITTFKDQASTVTKTENFEWYFRCESKPVETPEKINYTYEESPVYKEQCAACSGRGYFEESQTCTKCAGKGVYVNIYDGKTYTCNRCNGTGKEKIKKTCQTCYGRGVIEYPKTNLPPTTSSEFWKGWKVQVITTPAGAKVSIIDTKTGNYKGAGLSPTMVDWYYTTSKPSPILIESQGQSLKVLPYTSSGNESPKVQVDFSSGNPVVKVGKIFIQ